MSRISSGPRFRNAAIGPSLVMAAAVGQHSQTRRSTALSTTWFREMPADYKAVLADVGRARDFKDGVLKINIPRNDLTVTIRHRQAPTPFGFGGWVAFTKGAQEMDVMMGDLVLTEDEVSPVMSALLDNGLDVTALHNHFFWEQPRIFYMHVHGMGRAAELTAGLA